MHDATSISKIFKWWKQRTVNDDTQFCACCGWARTLTAKAVGRGRDCYCWAMGLRRRGADNGSQVFTSSMLTALRLISLTVAFAAGSARASGLDASSYIIAYIGRWPPSYGIIRFYMSHVGLYFLKSSTSVIVIKLSLKMHSKATTDINCMKFNVILCERTLVLGLIIAIVCPLGAHRRLFLAKSMECAILFYHLCL